MTAPKYQSLEDYLRQHNLTEMKGDFVGGGFCEVDV